jgi:hypothetical protein
MACSRVKALNMYAQEHLGRGDTEISGKRGLISVSDDSTCEGTFIYSRYDYSNDNLVRFPEF